MKNRKLYNPLLEVCNLCVKTYTEELAQSSTRVFRHAVKSDKHVWSQSIYAN